MSAEPSQLEDNPVEYRCFHCEEVLVGRRAAQDHFGLDEGDLPVCKSDPNLTEALSQARWWRHEALNEREKNEQLVYSARSELAELLSLFGTADLRQICSLYERMKDSRRAEAKLFASLIRYDMDAASIVFAKHDKMLVEPESYLQTLARVETTGMI